MGRQVWGPRLSLIKVPSLGWALESPVPECLTKGGVCMGRKPQVTTDPSPGVRVPYFEFCPLYLIV